MNSIVILQNFKRNATKFLFDRRPILFSVSLIFVHTVNISLTEPVGALDETEYESMNLCLFIYFFCFFLLAVLCKLSFFLNC